MNVLSLFSGIGGFDLGLERAGMTVVAQADNDPFCNKVLAHHWPGVTRFNDVRDIGLGSGQCDQQGQQDEAQAGEPHDALAGHVDLICGGFPCQDLSVAGKRAGLDGDRSGLWFEFKRILSELRPQWAIIENVPGLLSSNKGRDFGIILDGLGECGFGGIAWAILDSQHFGVAQRRRRVYVVAGPSRRSVEQVLSLCESCGGHPAPRRTPGEDVTGPVAGGAYGTGRRTEDDPNLVLANTMGAHHHRYDLDNETYVPVLAGTLNTHDGDKWGSNQWVNEDKMVIAHTLSADGFDASEDGTGRGTPLISVRTAQTGSNGWGVDESETAYTLDGANGQAVAGASVRRLTPTECERLQGFPDGWTALEGAADGPRYKALGNAVTTFVVQYLGERIIAVDAALQEMRASQSAD